MNEEIREMREIGEVPMDLLSIALIGVALGALVESTLPPAVLSLLD